MKVNCQTKNQHYVSQIEQRLNSINPNAAKKNQRIYTFNILDHDQYIVELKDQKGSLIETNLSIYDLFSFDVIDNSLRGNFESIFGKYERTINNQTTLLLSKLSLGDNQISEELFNLFVCKLLNFFRNPFSIEKIMNTIGDLADFHPLDAELFSIYSRIENGNKPHEEHVCSFLGISKSIYRKWLKCLFMLLSTPVSGEPNILEKAIKNLYENKNNLVNIYLFQYDGDHSDKRPILSDRGFTTPFEEDGCLAISFNLNAHSFITFTITVIDEQTLVQVSEQLQKCLSKVTKSISFHCQKNELAALSTYNKNTILQAKGNVFCSSKFIYL